MRKTEFKHYLSKRYSLQIAEKIVGVFDFAKPWTYRDYVNAMELLLYQNDDFFFKLVKI